MATTRMGDKNDIWSYREHLADGVYREYTPLYVNNFIIAMLVKYVEFDDVSYQWETSNGKIITSMTQPENFWSYVCDVYDGYAGIAARPV